MRWVPPLSLLLASAVAAQPQPARRARVDFARQWCTPCHVAPDPEADLDLPALLGDNRLDHGTLLRIRDALRYRDMPPEDEPQPPDADRAAMLRWLGDALERDGSGTPAPVPLRRLSIPEYVEAVRAVFGVDPATVGVDLEALGEGPGLATPQLEAALAAAERIVAAALPLEDPDQPPVQRAEGEEMRSVSGHQDVRGEFGNLYTAGEVETDVIARRTGTYRLRVRLAGERAGPDLPRALVRLDGRTIAEKDIEGTQDEPETLDLEVSLERGPHRFGVAYHNDWYDPDAADPHARDRNLLLDQVECIGPIDRQPQTAAESLVRSLDPGFGAPPTRARPILEGLASRAWRRPIAGHELSRLQALVASAVTRGGRFEDGLRLAAQAILASPHFVLHVERGVDDADQSPLDGWSLAARLSFWLWSAPPDDELRALAAKGALADPDRLAAQARRLLDDPRADALAEVFVPRWLRLDRLQTANPDPTRFPPLDDELRASMVRESVLLFRTVLREHRPIHTLVDADFTFWNGDLAAHAGSSSVSGPDFVRVALPPARRLGLLGHAGVLLATSDPTRTSPVRRGKWILDALLGDPPDPPPPNVPELPHTSTVARSADLRAALAEHRRDPQCARCHARMDALGLALEQFDAVGRYRPQDAAGPVDASSVLPDGRRLDGARDVVALVRSDHAFVRTVAAALIEHAIGRPPAPGELAALDHLAIELGADATLTELVPALVRLDLFRERSLQPSPEDS